MKKRIPAISFVLLASAVVGYFLIRSNQTIQQQERALKELSAKTERLERDASSAVNSPGASDNFLNLALPNFLEHPAFDSQDSGGELKAQMDRMRRNLAKLQDQVDELRKRNHLLSADRPAPSNSKSIPALEAEKDKLATLVENGKLLYKLDKYDEAEAVFNDVLHQDQNNRAAFYYMELLREARYANNQRFNRMPNGVVVPDSQSTSVVPPSWTPFEFNGATYYRIPLAAAN